MSGWSQSSGSTPDPSQDEDGGQRNSFGKEFAAHLKARAELLGLEAREAGELVARKGVLGIAVALLALFAYTLVLTGAVGLLGVWLERTWPDPFRGIGWQLIALLAGCLHLLLALILAKLLKRKPDHDLFEFTRAEFKKDRQWLNHPKSTANENENSP